MAISVVHTTTATASPITIPSTAAGNCLVVVITTASANSPTNAVISGVTLGGAAGNFSQIASASQFIGFTGEADVFIWADPNCAGGQTSVAVSGTNVVGPSYAVYEVSGLVTASVLDQSSTNNSTTGAATSGTTPTTTQAQEIWIGAISTDGSVTGPSTPWTTTSLGAGIAASGYQIVSSTGTATYAAATNSGNAWSAAVVTLKGASAGVSGTVQPRATVPVPRRRATRGVWQRITGQAFVKVAAPVQQPKPAPRRKPARALVSFVPVTTTNAPPPPPPSGTVQPLATVPVPRRTRARAVARGLAVPGIRGTAPRQEYQTPPRRRQARAWTRFTPVKTTNAPRQLLVSIASQAGADDYGTTFPQGILATAGVIEGPTLVGSDAFFYNGTPALGSLTQSVTEVSGTDAYGNAYIAGTATYANNGTFWSAVVIDSGVVSWYKATTSAGPWTSEAGIGFSWNSLTGGGLSFTGPAGNSMTGDLNVSGNITVTTTLTVAGTDVGATLNAIRVALSGASTTTNGLPNGTITGTSGGASTGTAHTHGGGSYSVTNGQHSHTLPTF